MGVESIVVDGAFTFTGITFQAQHGSQWIDLSGTASNSMTNGVTQSFSTMIGSGYEVSFYVGSATNGSNVFPSTVDLSINGGPRLSFTNPNAPTNMLDWRLFTVNFTATSSSTNLTFFNGSASTNFLSGLDNVSVIAVPEASPIVLFVGLIAVGAMVQRRSTSLSPVEPNLPNGRPESGPGELLDGAQHLRRSAGRGAEAILVGRLIRTAFRRESMAAFAPIASMQS